MSQTVVLLTYFLHLISHIFRDSFALLVGCLTTSVRYCYRLGWRTYSAKNNRSSSLKNQHLCFSFYAFIFHPATYETVLRFVFIEIDFCVCLMECFSTRNSWGGKGKRYVVGTLEEFIKPQIVCCTQIKHRFKSL